jgi:hypothetical protein
MGQSPKLHGTMHAIVENQVALGDATVVPATLTRLMREGLDRHDAIHAIGSVLMAIIFDVVTKNADTDGDINAKYEGVARRVDCCGLANTARLNRVTMAGINNCRTHERRVWRLHATGRQQGLLPRREACSLKGDKDLTHSNKDDAATAAFLRATENIQKAIRDIDGWDACLALTLCLAECIVFGNSEHDTADEAMRLAQTMKVLGDVALDLMAGEDDWDEDDDHSHPSPPSPDLLRKFLERRRTAKDRP